MNAILLLFVVAATLGAVPWPLPDSAPGAEKLFQSVSSALASEALDKAEQILDFPGAILSELSRDSA